MTHEQARFRGERQQPLDRAIELVRVAARKIGARGAVIRHEQRVADKDGIIDLVADVRRRMARACAVTSTFKLADLELLAVRNRRSKSLPSVFRSVALKTAGRCAARP